MEGNLNVIGIRRETKNYWECRTPIIPSDVKLLIQSGIKVVVQPSSSRYFRDSEFESVGAEINEDLSEASIIFGVKEVLPDDFLSNRIYCFFAHTFKGQYYNMPMLDSMISHKITLVDYENIRNPEGKRTVALGRNGGNSGALDFMQGLGKYLLMKNISSPFLCQGFAYMYRDLDHIQEDIQKIAELIRNGGLQKEICPMVWGILGTGRTSQGVQEILRMLPHKEITPEELLTLNPGSESQFMIYIVAFSTNHLYCRKSDGGFDRQEFQDQPSLYKSVFAEKYGRLVSVIFCCLYYESKYPRVLRADDIPKLERLLGICDISCDYRGAIEICYKFTTPEEPFFLYNPTDKRMYELCKAHTNGSILYYSMDFLPTELPRDASKRLSNSMINYILELTKGNYQGPLEDSGLSSDLIGCIHLYKGELTAKYQYIDHLRSKMPPHKFKASENITEIERIMREYPQLASDVENSQYGQELTQESKVAIMRLAEILEREIQV